MTNHDDGLRFQVTQIAHRLKGVPEGLRDIRGPISTLAGTLSKALEDQTKATGELAVAMHAAVAGLAKVIGEQTAAQREASAASDRHSRALFWATIVIAIAAIVQAIGAVLQAYAAFGK